MQVQDVFVYTEELTTFAPAPAVLFDIGSVPYLDLKLSQVNGAEFSRIVALLWHICRVHCP